MNIPEGTANLVIDYEVDDSHPVKYEQVGNDLIRLVPSKLFMPHQDGIGFVELIDARGVIIAASDPGRVVRHSEIDVTALRIIPGVK